MRLRVLVVLLLASIDAFARQPHGAATEHTALDHQQFIRECGLGVQRLPMDGGKIYGWKLNDRVTTAGFHQVGRR